MNWLKRLFSKPEPQEPEPLFCEIEETFGTLVYRTKGATMLARKIHHFEDDFEKTVEDYLMKTPNGRYFHQHHALYRSGNHYDSIYPYTKEEAITLYNGMPDKIVPFSEAFGEDLQDA